MIPRATVDKILDAAQIKDVVEDFVPLKRRGANYTACCPFHNEKTPSFYVSPAKGIYKCFGCGKAGSAVNFVMEHENLSYVEALKYLARKYNIEVIEKEETAEEIAARQKNESLLLATDFAAKFFVDQLKTPDGLALGYNYFKSRGLEDGTIAKFGLGWSPRSREGSLTKAAREAGFKEGFLVESGLSVKRDDGSLADRFYERAMFPIHSASGRVIAFGGRTLRGDKTVAKYVNSPESEIYKKSYTLYGIYFAKNEIARQDKCVLVEGYLDVISMHQLGITNVVASSGTSLTVEQVKLIHKFTENVTIIYDGDAAGIHAALRGIGLVLRQGLNVKVVLLPDGDDPDSFSRKHTKDEVNDFILTHERDFIGFMTDMLLGEAGDDPLKKANLINEVADTIALIPDAVKRSVYVESCSEKFNIDDQILFQRIVRTRDAILLEERKRWQNKDEVTESRQGSTRESEETAGGLQIRRNTADNGNAAGNGDTAENGNAAENGYAARNGLLNDLYLAACEKELLGFVLNNGQDMLEFDRDSEYWTEEQSNVADFIDASLAADDEAFANDSYRKTYEQYFTFYEEGLDQQQITRRMMDGQDREIAGVTQDLVIPKYDITVRSFEGSMTAQSTRLVTFVPRSVLIYKEKRVDERIRECTSRLTAIPLENEAETEQTLLELKQLNDTKTLLNEKLGRRPERK